MHYDNIAGVFSSLHRLGCSFLLPFLQSETPPKGILQESFSFLSEMEDSFFIFLQFGTPQKERDSFGFEGIKGFLRFPT